MVPSLFSGHLHQVGWLLLAVLGEAHYSSRETLTLYSLCGEDLCNAQRRASRHTYQQDLPIILRENIHDIIGYLLGRDQRLYIGCSCDLDLTLITSKRRCKEFDAIIFRDKHAMCPENLAIICCA